MLGKSTIKLVKSLAYKKYRDAHGLFVAEGEKIATEILSSSIKIKYLIALKSWFEKTADFSKVQNNVQNVIQVSDIEMKNLSLLSTHSNVMTVCEIPAAPPFDINEKHEGLSLVLDEIQDPGNLGTIVRLADWFGVQRIYCSKTTADIYNPKTVQSTMGAICRISLIYTDLPILLEKSEKTIYGAFLDGENIYNQELQQNAFLVLGNEGKGISQIIENKCNKRIFIPNFSQAKQKTESLNVAVATAIICSEFRRQSLFTNNFR